MMDLEKAMEAVQSIYANPKLTKMQKRIQASRIIGSAHKEKEAVKKEILKADIELNRLEEQRDKTKRFIDALGDIKAAWGTDLEGDMSLWSNVTIQPNDCSRLHKLGEAISSGHVHYANDEGELQLDGLPADLKTFVIAHDWAAIVDQSAGTEEVVLPYDTCSFEFRASGRTVIVIAEQEEGATAIGAVFYEASSGDWMCLGEGTGTMWWAQVRAACIVLEAEVATHEVRRASHQLNVKRIKAGKLLMYDFHIVDLSKRMRAVGGEAGHSGTRKRLHFCRGHWRHFETRKTWIKWCLKGDSSLGFVGKEYRL